MSGLKTILVAVNAKYVHTNIAVRYISRYCQKQNIDCSFREFTINEPQENVLAKLYSLDCDVYGFSCYIWNIEYILKICQNLKKLRPERKIFLGGPEISFDGEAVLEKAKFIDWVVCGEGEKIVAKILDSNFPQDRCVIYGEKICDMDELLFPYTEEDLKKVVDGEKLVYYETSRGCPFSCSYCLSSVENGVRLLPLDRVKSEIEMIVKSGAQTIKFVDRTFNADRNRANELWKHCLTLEGDTLFHFEIGADLLTDEQIDLLKCEGAKKFQFEIGVQTTNPKTILEISRSMNLERLAHNIKRLRNETSVMLHLDLIAGLPYEDFETFKKSFNDVYELNPNVLQLGFLKLLKGSELRQNAPKYMTRYSDFAPYEVFETKWLSYDSIIKLKAVEDVLERYFNSGRFENMLGRVMDMFESPFEFYSELSRYWTENGLVGQGVKRISLYSHMYDFLKGKLNEESLAEVIKAMKTDFSKWHSNGVGTPNWYKKY